MTKLNMYIYLTYLSIFFAVPCLLLGWFFRHELKKYRRTVLWCFAFVFVLGGMWDWLAVRTGLWRYDSARTLGLWLAGLPVEELVGFYLLGTFLVVITSLAFLSRESQPERAPGQPEAAQASIGQEAPTDAAPAQSDKRGGA